MTTSPSDPPGGAASEPPESAGEESAPAEAPEAAETPEVHDDGAPETPEEEIAATQESTEEATDAPVARGDDETAGVSSAAPADDSEPGTGEGEPGEGADDDAGDDEQPDPLAGFAAEVAGLAGASSWTVAHGTVKLQVARDQWHPAVAATAGRLPFFSWLSAVDWARSVEVGEPAEDADELDERYEVLCRLSSVVDASAVILTTDVPKDDPWMPSIIDVLPGAGWHERETAEMFGLDFVGNPNKKHLYLPDSFEGHPLRKDYPLLSREVKPWPGTVDVEGKPGTENVEAARDEADDDIEIGGEG